MAVAGQIDGDAQGHAARNDGDLVDGVGVLAHERDQRVPRFVIGGDPLLLVGEQHGLALGAHEHLVLGQLEVVHHDLLAIDASGVEGGLVDHVGQVGSAEAGCAASQDVEVGVVGDGNLLDVHAEDLFAAAHVGQAHHHAAVEAAGAQQRGIKHVGAVGGRDEDDAVVRFESVHFDEQLIQRLLALVVSAAEAGTAMTADGVDFVDEDDAGSVLLALFEEIANAACADADEHLNKVGAGDGEEGHVGFAGHGARQQGLAGSRRPDEQHALGNAAAQLLELLRLAQVLDDLLQLFLGLVDAGHILEGDLLLLHREQACTALAERQRLVAARLHLPQHEEPDGAEQDERSDVDEQGNEDVVLLVLEQDGNLGCVQLVRSGRRCSAESWCGIAPSERGFQVAVESRCLEW